MNPSEILLECISKSGNSNIKFIAEWDDDVSIGPEITIMTKSYLFSFCKYLLTSYYSPALRSQLLGEYFDRIGNGQLGGICDMRALANYSKLYFDNAFNLKTLDEPLIITNFNSFLDKYGSTDHWKVSFQTDKQTLYAENKQSTLIGTHFQGRAKTYMCFSSGEDSEITQRICLEHLRSNRYRLEKAGSFLKRGVNNLISMVLDSRFYSSFYIIFRKIYGFIFEDLAKSLKQ
jgi:hypothetical protein